MKIGLYSPYLNMLGGGEKYFFDIASALSENHDTTIFGDCALQEKASDIFHISLKRVRFVPRETLTGVGIFNRFRQVGNFDAFFYMSDGSIFYPSAKKNFLIIQSPVHFPPQTIGNILKLRNWRIICYSRFVADVIQKKFGKEAYMLPPCVGGNDSKVKRQKKEKIILTVGRFFLYPHSKRHDVLIDAFRSLLNGGLRGWKLVIIGGLTEKGGREILDDLKNRSRNLPTEIYTNASYSVLTSYYKKATFYWHAAGFGENLDVHPERAEHFGITTIEAMKMGAIPLVYDGGGQRDIVINGTSGYLWKTPEELVRLTAYIHRDNSLRMKLSYNAMIRSKEFSCSNFYEKLTTLLER